MLSLSRGESAVGQTVEVLSVKGLIAVGQGVKVLSVRGQNRGQSRGEVRSVKG